MRSIFICFAIIIFTVNMFPVTTVIPTDHIKPFRIRVDDQRIFISEGAQISVYSRKNFKLIFRFGKAGEGPGEFKLLPEFGPEMDVGSGKILATSMGKITLISFEGKFISEKNTSELGRVELFRPLGEKYAGNALTVQDKKIWNVINIYDKDLKNPRTIHRIPFHMKRGEPFNPITRGLYLPNFYISAGRIWVGGALYRDNILMYDDTGKLIRDLDPEIEKVKFTTKDKQGWIDSYMINADYKREYERLKHLFLYPDYFPLWQNFILEGDKLFIQTFARNDKDGTNRFYIYDTGGKFLKTVWLPLTEYFDFTPDPYYIHDNMLYQLSNNFETEIIELRITPIR
jgi:hypothetical protein